MNLRSAAVQAREALDLVTTSETFYRDPRGDRAGPAIDALDAALSQEAASPVQVEPREPFTAKAKGLIAGDGQPCPNDHDPDCRWPQCLCRDRLQADQQEARNG